MRIDFKFPVGPQHPVGNFVSDLDIFGQNTFVLKAFEDGLGVIEDAFFELDPGFCSKPLA